MVTHPQAKSSIWTKATAALTGAAASVAQAVTLTDEQRLAALTDTTIPAAEQRLAEAQRSIQRALAAGLDANEAYAARDAAQAELDMVQDTAAGIRQHIRDRKAAGQQAGNEARDTALAEAIDDTLSTAAECDKALNALHVKLIELGQNASQIAALSGHLPAVRAQLSITLHNVPVLLANKARMGSAHPMPPAKPNLIDHFSIVGEMTPGYRGAAIIKGAA